MNPPYGKVYLVGAGPGDPGLITVRGKELLTKAQVVVYDYLANPSLLEVAPQGAEVIYVGKQGGDHTLGQEEINALLVEKAKQGKCVVRLKGGDPFIFGRGGEEAEALVKAGVAFEAVPGVTSAISVPAYAGIPLTHRDYTSTVAFITGHEDPTKGASDIAWDKLATGAGTLVFLMGVGNLQKIAQSLMDHGRSPDTPVAVIRRGTVPEQRTLVGPLKDIARLAKEQAMKPPAIIVVGDVVDLRQTLNWFETRPLFGRRIIVTRAREQASGFRQALTELGAECIEFPTIEVTAPRSWEPLDRAIGSLDQYSWVLFTSVNGVRYFLERLKAIGRDIRDLKGMKIGAIGPTTADMWVRMGIQPDLVPDEYRAEALVEQFRNLGVEGQKILLPRASEAREVLPSELEKMGARVDVVPAYETIRPKARVAEVQALLEKGSIDMVTFTSSSTVSNFMDMFEAESVLEWMSGVSVACIGPITAKTAEERGLTVHVIPKEYTIEALTQAMVTFFSK